MPFVEETILSPVCIVGTVGLQPPPELPRYNVKLVPILGRQADNLRKKADSSRCVGGKFYKQGNFPTRLVFDGCKTSNFLHPPSHLKVSTEALTGGSHVHRRPYHGSVTHPV